MLTYRDVEKLLPDPKGIRGVPITFQTISFQSSLTQPKSLFIALDEDCDLLAAIANGAVAAIWPKAKAIPSYAPNHFPIFLAEDPGKMTIKLIEKNKEKISIRKSGDQTEMKIKNIIPENKFYEKLQSLFQDENGSSIREGDDS